MQIRTDTLYIVVVATWSSEYVFYSLRDERAVRLPEAVSASPCHSG